MKLRRCKAKSSRAVSIDQATAEEGKYSRLDDYILIPAGKTYEIKTQAERAGPVTVIPLSEE